MKPQALIIEDNPSDQILNSIILEAWGFQCTIAANGEDAIPHILNRKFDLIVLDLRMAHIDGMQFLTSFRNVPLNQFTPVIVVSGRTDPFSQKYTKDLGVYDFIKKPLDVENHRYIFERFLSPFYSEFFYE